MFIAYSYLPMEKRRQQRVRCEIEGSLKVFNTASAGAIHSIAVNDLSEGGIRFRTSHFIPIKQQFYFNLLTPRDFSIQSTGELAWIREIPSLNCYEAGAKFVNFPSEHKHFLHHLLFEQLLAR